MKRSNTQETENLVKKNKTNAFDQKLSETCINTVRVLSADMVQKANAGHPGAPMGCAPIAHVLFGSNMNFSSSNPKWINRDRFVLSNGHACALLYSMLHLTGYDLSMDDIKQFRQLGSKTPGHPENYLTPGVEVSTGPLGQGISNAVGLALAESHLAATFNKGQFNVIDHYTYVICGDGCLQEGVASEACSLAGHLGLGKLIVCYDDNGITIDGETSLSFTEDVGMRFTSYGWHVLEVKDGNDIQAIQTAINEAKNVTDKPSLIKIKTIIGYGSAKQGTEGVHGAPLGAADIANVKKKFGFDPEKSFNVPDEVYDFYRSVSQVGKLKEQDWNQMFEQYSHDYPDLAKDLQMRMNNMLPATWKNDLPQYSSNEEKSAATRKRSEEVLNGFAKNISAIIGGSADLTPSNLTNLKCSKDYQKNTPDGRYIRFGVREHGMAAICNGIFAHGGLRPYCATFLNFIGYALGSVRLSALSKFGVLYIMTHDSIGLGEDGPTHQPIEILEMLRATPNLYTIRPADGNEVKGAYQVALESLSTPTVLSLSRQNAPTLENSSADNVKLGAYVMKEFKSNDALKLSYPTLTLIGTGTEVKLAIDVAQELFNGRNDAPIWIRVVSMPCCELYDSQSDDYQKSILMPGSPVMSIEASCKNGWRKYAHAPFGIESFGLSAPGNKVYTHFGFDVANLATRARQVISFYQSNDKTAHPYAPSMLDVPQFPRITH